MLRFALGLVAAPLLAAVAFRSPAPAAIPAAPGAIFLHEPIVVFEVAGSTFAGPVDRKLVVYNDGSASMSMTATYLPGGKAESAFVGANAANRLATDLKAAGVFRLTDTPLIGTVSDMPLTTVSALVPKTDARAHTYSYYIPTAQQSVVEGILQGFISTYFPTF